MVWIDHDLRSNQGERTMNIKKLAELQKKEREKPLNDVLQRLNELQRGPKRMYIRKRKNLSRITNILEQAMKDGIIEPGSIIDTRNLSDALGDEASQWFNRSYERGDENGPTRALGDLIGGHGLHLRRVAPCRYLIPTKLPTVSNDHLTEEAVY